MGKTALGLALARNVAEWGSAGFLSMEMPKAQINDRNIAAMGQIPISWLRKPDEADENNWTRLTAAFEKAQRLKLWIDDETGLNVTAIRSKARFIKRRSGLDLLVIDQLSFISGSKAENKAYEIGDYTRGLLAVAKELDCAVLLLAQLNRECEKRNNKRPMLSDLSSSGSIEQDASTVMMLYRDEVYNPDTSDKGICEAIIVKQRQGETGVAPLTYIGNQTRFENVAFRWQPPAMREEARARGFD
jgi:replicative DNA helicase